MQDGEPVEAPGYGDAEDVPGQPADGNRMDVRQAPPQPSGQPRITTRYMTKYEKARILGTRALQIRCGGQWLR